MSYLQAQTSDRDSAIREFREKVARCTVKAVCGREYVLVKKLKKWMTSPWQGTGKTQIDRLLLAAYHYERDSNPGILSFSSKMSPKSEDYCLLVFSILLFLGRPELIQKFQEMNFIDKKLPISLLDLETRLKNMQDGEDIAARFDNLQWQFCAHVFDLGTSKEYPEKQIMPICRKEKINKGGTAQVWQILVQQEFVGFSLQRAVSSDPHARIDDPQFGPCFQFALKTFEEGKIFLYLDEKKVYQSLQNAEGMVRCLGDYRHSEYILSTTTPNPADNTGRGRTTKMTYNILLEYGEFDLNMIFIHRLPPVLATEIVNFWKALFEISEAVENIHNLKTEVGEYSGWHSDIKPENILWVQERYKLADPGFAKFKRKLETDPSSKPEMLLLGGTKTYGAPERLSAKRSTHTPVYQSIDIWSLGCVFSMAATWVVLGSQGIRQYAKVRERAIDAIRKNQRNGQTRQPSSFRVLDAGDYFHNGRDCLAEVTSWHKFLRMSARKTDPITPFLLDIVDQKMLLGDERRRISAKDLCLNLKTLVGSCQPDPIQNDMKTIMEALLEVDEEALSRTSGSVLQSTPRLVIPESQEGHKSKLSDLPLMKTSHRSEFLKSVLPHRLVEIESNGQLFESPVQSEFGIGEFQHFEEQPGPSRQHPRYSTVQSPRIGYSHRRDASQLTTASAPPGISRTQGPLPNYSPQNAIQVREAIVRKRKLWKKISQDSLLSLHFKNRDIKFLVDNAKSMALFWDEATFLVEILVLKAAGQDPDGMDLSFTLGKEAVWGKKDKEPFRKAMHRAKPQENSVTDIRQSLSEIFGKFINQAKKDMKNKRTPKNLTLIVLTDGIWAGTMGRSQVKFTIKDFVNTLKNEGITTFDARTVGIEFIQFGDDEEATERLRRLDNTIKYDGIPDIIDHEIFSIRGDVNKMLLGNFVPAFDSLDDYDEASDSANLSPGFESRSNFSAVDPLSQPSTYQPTAQGPQEADPFTSPTRSQTYNSISTIRPGDGKHAPF